MKNGRSARGAVAVMRRRTLSSRRQAPRSHLLDLVERAQVAALLQHRARDEHELEQQDGEEQHGGEAPPHALGKAGVVRALGLGRFSTV